MKKNLLSIAGVLFLGLTANAQTIVYSNDFSTAPSPSGSGAFTHASDGSNWTITAAGHGEWDQFDIVFDTPLDFSVSGNKPIVSIKASTTQTVGFEVLLVDENGHITDKPLDLPGQPLFFNIKAGDPVKAFSYDFTGQFEDHYGNAGSAQGAVDSTKITSIRFKINPGWASSAYTYRVGEADAAEYKKALNGTITIDKLQIGAALANSVKTLSNEIVSVYPNPSNGLVNVNLNKNSELVTVSVSNVLGQEIFTSSTNQSNIVIDLSGKTAGIYYISIRTAEGVSTQRLFLN
ncbi:MAG: T9SS type A sorting domain-containing protein [Flavobacteriales bacterium]